MILTTIGARSPQDSVLLGHQHRLSHYASKVSGVLSAFVVVVMLLGLGFASLINTAPSAAAGVPGVDGIISAICDKPPVNYEVKASTSDLLSPIHATTSANAYEKYGMLGTTYTTWLGFDTDASKINGEGSGSSRKLVKLAGNTAQESGLSQLASLDKTASHQSGLFNLSGKCGLFDTGRSTTGIANALLGATKWITYLSTVAISASATVSDSVYAYVGKPIEGITHTLKDRLYLDYLGVLIMLGALWIGWIGLAKRQTTKAGVGVVWMVAAIVGGIFLLNNPMALPNMTHSVVSGITSAGMNSIAGLTSASTDAGRTLCYTPVSKKDNKVTRETGCNLWYSFVYTPWVLGEFGKNPDDLAASEKSDPNGFLNRVKSDGGTVAWTPVSTPDKTIGLKPLNTLNASANGKPAKLTKVAINGKVVTDSSQTWALYFLDHRVVAYKGDDAANADGIRGQLNVTMNQLASGDYNAAFKGGPQAGAGRGWTALLALVGAGVAGFMILYLGIQIIVRDLFVIVLALLSPLFALAGVHPGAGRHIAMGWLSRIMNNGIERILLGLWLSILVMVLGVIQAIPAAGWVISIILTIAVGVLGVKFTQPVLGLFRGFNLNDLAYTKAIRKTEEGIEEIREKAEFVTNPKAALAGTALGRGLGGIRRTTGAISETARSLSNRNNNQPPTPGTPESGTQNRSAMDGEVPNRSAGTR